MDIRLNRRQLLAALAAVSAMPTRAKADSVSNRRFIFVYTMGGWDPTRVFTDQRGSENVATEVDIVPATIGGITYMDHPERPSVKRFFEAWHERTLVLNGVYCPSISHSGALKVTWTNHSGGLLPDWPTRIASVQSELYVVPYLVVGGPYFAGDNGVYVCRAGNANQLSDLVTGNAVADADMPGTPPPKTAMAAVDAWVLAEAERLSGNADAARAKAATTWANAEGRAIELKTIGENLDFSSGDEFSEQLDLGVRALSTGLSRVVSLTHPRQNSLTAWDSHALNDEVQNELYESLFDALDALMLKLETTDAPEGGTLADITTVVVMSEMGRTPYNNNSGGKDHWPYTTAMYIGKSITGDRMVGSFDEQLYGETIDLASGEADDGGEQMHVAIVGATLLRMADIDPESEGVTADPIEGVLA